MLFGEKTGGLGPPGCGRGSCGRFCLGLGRGSTCPHLGQRRHKAEFMVLLNLADALKQLGNLLKALFPGNLGKGGIHAAPLTIFALDGILQVFTAAAHPSQALIEQLPMHPFILGHLFKQIGNILPALLPGLLGIEIVFVPGHGLSAEGRQQILFGTGSFQFHM